MGGFRSRRTGAKLSTMNSTTADTRQRRRIATIALAPLLALAAGLSGPPPAEAAVTCTFDSQDIVNVAMTANNDSVGLSVDGSGNIVVEATAPITCPGTGGPPTVTNTETVLIADNSDDPATPAPEDGSTEVRITEPTDFSPGDTQEQGSDAFSEIEFLINLDDGANDRFQVLGTAGTDNWVIGDNTLLNWNAGVADPVPDSDLGLSAPFDQWTLRGNAGNDVISARGGAGTGAVFNDSDKLNLFGGPDDDVISGGDSTTGDFLVGEAGNDSLSGFAGDDGFQPLGGDDTVSGGAGIGDRVLFNGATDFTIDLTQTGPQNTGEGNDTIGGIEEVRTGSGNDTVIGDASANDIDTFAGDDLIEGGGGDDRLLGDNGVDTLSYGGAPAGVTVNLTTGSTTGGAGTDTHNSFQNVIGSAFADSLTGNALDNSITAGDGIDIVSAEAGADVVLVRDGGPDSASCGADIDTATADRASVDQVNADCETVDFLPELEPPPGPEDGEISFDLAGKTKQRIVARKLVVVRVSCPLEACTAKVRGGKVRPREEGLDAGVAEPIQLRLKRGKLAAIERALEAGRKPKVKVRAEGTDAAGNVATDTLTVIAKP